MSGLPGYAMWGNEFLCVECRERAEYIYLGKSLCAEHFEKLKKKALPIPTTKESK